MKEFKELMYLDWRYRNYKASTFANGLIYFLGRLPLIGRFIPTTMLYREYGLKKAIAIIQLIGSFLLQFFLNSVPFFISLVLSAVVNDFVSREISVFLVWFVLFNFLGTLIGGMFPSLHKQEIQFMEFFRVSKEQYIKRTSILSIIQSLFFMLPGLLFVGIKEGKVVLYILIAWFSYLTFSLIWLYLEVHLALLKKRLVVKLMLVTIIGASVVGSILLLVNFNELHVLQNIIINWMSAFIWLMAWFPFLYLYVHFKKYDAYAIQMHESSEVMINYGGKTKEERQKTQYLGEGTKMKLEKTSDDKNLETLTGSRYLNALLFSRFKGALIKQLLIRLIGISVVMVAIITGFYLIPMSSAISSRLEIILYDIIPSMFFVLYLLSFGKKIVQTVFVNCDSSMLSYPFYREPKAIIRGFFYRFFKTLQYNSLITLTIYLWLILFNVINGYLLSLDFFLLLFYVMVSLSILFSFHDLFIYYTLQPFTSDLQVKNPVYKFVDWLFYFIAYMSLQIKSGGLIYGIIVSSVSIIYFAIGIVVILKVAPKTFKLKN